MECEDSSGQKIGFLFDHRIDTTTEGRLYAFTPIREELALQMQDLTILRHPGNLESMAIDMVRNYATNLLHALGGQSEDFSAFLDNPERLSTAHYCVVFLLRDIKALQVIPAGEGLDLAPNPGPQTGG